MANTIHPSLSCTNVAHANAVSSLVAPHASCIMHHTVYPPLLFIDHGEGRKGVHKALLGLSMLSLLALLPFFFLIFLALVLLFFLFLRSSATLRTLTFGQRHRIGKTTLRQSTDIHPSSNSFACSCLALNNCRHGASQTALWG